MSDVEIESMSEVEVEPGSGEVDCEAHPEDPRCLDELHPPLEREIEKAAETLAERFDGTDESQLHEALSKAADTLGADARVTQFLHVLAERRVAAELRDRGAAAGG